MKKIVLSVFLATASYVGVAKTKCLKDLWGNDHCFTKLENKPEPGCTTYTYHRNGKLKYLFVDCG